MGLITCDRCGVPLTWEDALELPNWYCRSCYQFIKDLNHGDWPASYELPRVASKLPHVANESSYVANESSYVANESSYVANESARVGVPELGICIPYVSRNHF